MVKEPLVSIIVPVFNNEQYLQETINSLLNQTFDKWEAIFVDDGSTDNTEDIIIQNSEIDSRIRFIRREREPKGGSTCRNIGLLSAKGVYVIFLDGDDFISPMCLEKRLEAIQGTNLDFVAFPMATFKGSDQELHKLSRSDVKDYDYYFMTGCAVWQVTSPIYNADFAKKLNGFDERFKRFQDVEFGLRATAIAHGNFSSFCDNDPDCYYRIPNGKYSLSPEKLRRGLESYGFFIEVILSLRKQGYLSNRYKYSLGLLATYVNILHVIDLLKERNEEVENFDAYNTFDIRKEMMLHHRLLLFLFIKITRPLKLHLRLTHLCNQYCRLHYLKW